MGTDLILQYKGKNVVNLGRAYDFDSIETIEREIDFVENEVIKRVVALATYTPKDLEDADRAAREAERLVYGLSESLIDLGRQLLLETLLEENKDFTTIKE
jgi:hypothetical protein